MRIIVVLCCCVLLLSACNKKPDRRQKTVNGTEQQEQERQKAVPQNIIDITGPTVVDFYATWCGPCRELAPVLEQLEMKYKGRVRFLRIDVDEQPDLAQSFQIESIPTLLYITGDGVVDATIGLVEMSDIESRLQKML